jgi:RNA polymerase sigma factor (sigma-70 family)
MNSPGKKTWIELYREDSESAWGIFLQKYIQLIMAVLSKFAQDHDDRMELYTYCVEQLKKDNLQKIISYFDQQREYAFEVWIAVVTRNCCMDWFRKRGRPRLLKCIENLQEIDQHIFEYIYRKGYSLEVTYQLLKSKHGYDEPYEAVLERLDSIEDALNRQTKWRILEARQTLLPLLSYDALDVGDARTGPSVTSEEDNPTAEEQVIRSETEQILNEVLLGLPSQERLIIRLHVIKGLTLEQTARILKMKSIWQVHRRLKKGSCKLFC